MNGKWETTFNAPITSQQLNTALRADDAKMVVQGVRKVVTIQP